MKLLLIDDSNERAELLARQLREAEPGATLRRVSSGDQLREALQQESFDAVLCDSAIADLGVATVLETLHERGADAPMFVVLEAVGEAAADEVLRALGGPKPRAGPPRQFQRAALAQATVDALPDAAILLDFDGGEPVVNLLFTEMWKLPPGLRAASLRALLDALPDAPRLILDLLAGDGVSRSSGSLELPDGRTLEWTSNPLMIEAEAIGRICVFRDITATLIAQQSLERSEAMYRSLIGNAPAVLWSANARGHITFVSPNVIALDGYTPEEICAGGKKGWLRRVHPDDQPRVAAAYAGLFTNELAFDVEYRVQHKNGSWIWLHDRAMSTYEMGGKRCADGVLLDITSQKAAELESRRLTHERELLFESAAEGICGIDRYGRTTFVNRAALEMLGFTADELIGQRLHDLMHHHRADGTPYLYSECATRGVFTRGERHRSVDEVFWRKDGTPLTVEYNAAPIFDHGDICGAVIIFSDTTERRAMERAIEQGHRIESLGRVAATIAHEFNNVLSAISPFGEVVRKEAGENRALISAAEHIRNSVLRGKRVTQEILRFTRPSPPILEPVGLSVALRRLSAELQASLPRTCVLEVLVEDETLEVMGDWPQLEQVITNLVLNARDAMRGIGNVTIRAEHCSGELPHVPDPQSFVHLTCHDDGPGMPPDIAARVFEPMFTTKRNGTGLGLAVAQQLITHHGGIIFVESEQNRGTTFHLLLRKAASQTANAIA